MGFSLTAPARISDFREALAAGPLLADGAMGTMLASRLSSKTGAGWLACRCLDELNLSLPALVRDVHQEYLRAGAQIIGTNTFGANRMRLGTFGFGDRVRSINQAGVRIARQAARGLGTARGLDDAHSLGATEAFVAGIVGPLGVKAAADATPLFREQMDALVESGVDLLVLETFGDLKELHAAIDAAREATREAGCPEMTVVAHVTVEDDGTLACGASIREFTRCLEEWPVDVVGVNCSSGPRVVLDTLEAMAAWSTKPFSAMPNAGLPVLVDGRDLYPCSPEYMAEYARRFLRVGARIVGGCCGTTPEHIRRMREVVDEEPAETDVRVIPVVEQRPRWIPGMEAQESVQKTPTQIPSHLGSKLASREFVIMVEILPPRGLDASREIAAAIQCKQAGIDCISVPDKPPGRPAMAAAAMCHLIQQQAGIECVLDFGRWNPQPRAFESLLLGAQALGIRNLVCGADGVALSAAGTLLAGFPVNPAALDPDEEIRGFERNVKTGAAFAVTPPVFDLELLEAFLQRIEPFKLPVIAGIRPLTSLRDAEFVVNELRTPVPAAYVARMSAAGSEFESEKVARAEGLVIAREILERLRGLVAGVRFTGPFDQPELLEALH